MGMYQAIEFVQPQQTFIVTPINGHYPVNENRMVCGLNEAIKLLFNHFPNPTRTPFYNP